MENKFVRSAIDILGIVWKDINTMPDKDEEGFIIVAKFNDAGSIVDFSEDYVYCKELCSCIVFNGGSGKYINDPTHYISKRKFKELLQLIPKENKSGGIEI